MEMKNTAWKDKRKRDCVHGMLIQCEVCSLWVITVASSVTLPTNWIQLGSNTTQNGSYHYQRYKTTFCFYTILIIE